MARPSTPLIVRSDVIRQGLELIDEVGFDAFSLPRLARRIGIQTPSLYHHFANRDAVLSQMARSVVDTVDVFAFDDVDLPWREWCVRMCMSMHDMILSRPKAAPLIMWYLTSHGMPQMHEHCGERLQQYSLTAEESSFVTHSLEQLTLGSASVQAMRVVRPTDETPEPKACSRELYVRSIRTFLNGVTVAVESPDSAVG